MSSLFIGHSISIADVAAGGVPGYLRVWSTERPWQGSYLNLKEYSDLLGSNSHSGRLDRYLRRSLTRLFVSRLVAVGRYMSDGRTVDPVLRNCLEEPSLGESEPGRNGGHNPSHWHGVAGIVSS